MDSSVGFPDTHGHVPGRLLRDAKVRCQFGAGGSVDIDRQQENGDCPAPIAKVAPFQHGVGLGGEGLPAILASVSPLLSGVDRVAHSVAIAMGAVNTKRPPLSYEPLFSGLIIGEHPGNLDNRKLGFLRLLHLSLPIFWTAHSKRVGRMLAKVNKDLANIV